MVEINEEKENKPSNQQSDNPMSNTTGAIKDIEEIVRYPISAENYWRGYSGGNNARAKYNEWEKMVRKKIEEDANERKKMRNGEEKRIASQQTDLFKIKFEKDIGADQVVKYKKTI